MIKISADELAEQDEFYNTVHLVWCTGGFHQFLARYSAGTRQYLPAYLDLMFNTDPIRVEICAYMTSRNVVVVVDVILCTRHYSWCRCCTGLRSESRRLLYSNKWLAGYQRRENLWL